MTDVAGSCVVVKGKPGMKFDGLIEGTPLEWKIDSGAVNTFITKEVYYSILPHQRPVLEPARKQFETADGSYLKLLGTARMILTLGDVDVCFRVFVGGVKCNLLGQDFMLRYECQWDYRSDSLILNCVHTSDYEERSCRVVTAENVGVPPRHEAVLKSRVLGGGNTGDGVLVPMKKFVHTHGLAIAHVVVTAKNSDVYVRVFNPGDGEICVKKNTEIALLAPVNFVSEPLHSENVCNVQKLSVSEEIPAFLQEVFDEGCRNLTLEEADKFRQFLIGRKSAFADPEMPAERAKIGEHCINLKDEMPFKEAVRRVPLYKREILDNEIDKLKEQGLIEESKSPWSSPIVLVQKKDKSWRLCVDYRRLNSQTIKDAYPIPRISDDLDALSGSKWFSSLDLNMAYHQIPMREADKEKTAFGTPRGGLYQYQVMPFGLCNAPATFQRVIEQALHGLQWHVTVLYLDDIIVYSRDFDQHLKNLNLVFDRLQDANLKLKAKKCSFFKREVAFLGHIVTEHGVMTDPGKTRAVDEWKTPENVSELRSFLGLVSYYRRFIKNFAHVAKCLHELTSKNVKWEWTTKCDEAFQSLKSELVNAPILGYPDVNGGSFILDTDASNDAIGAVLSQLQDGQEKVIAYASRTLTSAEKNYCVTRKEMLALIFFVKHFKHYLLGREFLLRTDHASLVWLHKFKEPDGQIARWLQQLGPYTFQIQHRVGKRHGNADALTRMSSGDNTCKQCKRDVTKDTSDRIYRNSDELRNTENCEESDKYCAESDKSDICAIDSLFSDISVVTDGCDDNVNEHCDDNDDDGCDDNVNEHCDDNDDDGCDDNVNEHCDDNDDDGCDDNVNEHGDDNDGDGCDDNVNEHCDDNVHDECDDNVEDGCGDSVDDGSVEVISISDNDANDDEPRDDGANDDEPRVNDANDDEPQRHGPQIAATEIRTIILTMRSRKTAYTNGRIETERDTEIAHSHAVDPEGIDFVQTAMDIMNEVPEHFRSRKVRIVECDDSA